MSTKTSSRQSKIYKKVKLATGRSRSPKHDGETLDSKKKVFRGNKTARFSLDDVVDGPYHDNKLYTKENGERRNVKSRTKTNSFYGETLDSRKGFRGNRNARVGMDDGVDVPFHDNKPYKEENGERRKVRSTTKSTPVYGETLRTKKKDFRGNRNARVSMDEGVDVSFHDSKLYKEENGERRNVRSKTKSRYVNELKADGERNFKTTNNDRKRKRVYADSDENKEGVFHENVETSTRKVFSKGRNELKYDVAEEERSMRGKSRGFEELERGRVLKGERKTLDRESVDKDGRKKLRLKLKATVKREYVQTDRGRNSSMKNDAKNKYDFRMQSEQKYNKLTADYSIGKSEKKKVYDKKSVSDDLAENDERPTKSKRVIRIDPRDTTNKRLDDGVVSTGHTKEKKEDTEKTESGEISQNAQFRAIKPSPSILSFVEDNLLGRRRLIELRRAGYNTELSAPLDNIPSSTSMERERIEEPIFRNKLAFFAAANISSSFPPPDLPEIAFAGRSNVGKSSLLNALTRQWGVVRTSDKPGLTQTINFFKLGSKLCLVDLPGYGFAYAKEEVKEAWEELVKEYVSTRVGLKRVCLLIDTKWGMKPRDHELIDLMERSQTKYQIVLTKTDLVFPIDVARRAMQIEESLKAKKSAVIPVMMASSKSGAGIRSLRTVLATISRFAKL